MSGLNKPAAPEGGPLAWGENLPPRWYLWEGGFMVIGRAGGEVPAHSHHAIQVHVATQGKVAIRTGSDPWREAGGTIVRADVEHSFNAHDVTGAMLMIDPESAEGTWLQSALAEDVTLVPESRLASCVAALTTFVERPLEAMDVGALVRHFVQAVTAGIPPSRKLDPRIQKVLAAIRESADLRMSLEAAAKLVHLSPGRFAHLFKEELGLPFRRYMLWRKVMRAMLAIGKEPTLAAAAQQGDFADAAHLTRTFYQMFGLPPSVMMRGEFFEIPSPFAAPARA
jgi:AraC-like DNA-binding protein